MTLKQVVIAKLQQLPESERLRLLVLIDEWIKQHTAADIKNVQQALLAVQSSWATLSLDQKTLRWAAQDRDLEYDLG